MNKKAAIYIRSFSEVFLVISILITLYVAIPIYQLLAKYTVEFIVTDKNLKTMTGIIGDGMRIE